MNRFSPIPVYLVGAPLVFTGLFALRNPLSAYSLFGVPDPAPSAQPSPSPFVHAKAVRDMALGLSCLALQHQGNDNGVTTILTVVILTGICDGYIVWRFGGDELRRKAWGHWLPSALVLAPWVLMRAVAY